MSLLNFQKEITIGNLYRVSRDDNACNANQINPSIYINSGSINVYSYNGATEPAARATMTLDSADTGITGNKFFEIIPTYISVVQNAGTSTEIVLSGVQIKDLGAI